MQLGIPALFGAWYVWIQPLWLVAVGAAVVTAAMFAVYFALVLTMPKIAAIARTTAKEAWSQPLFWVILSGATVMLMLFPFIPYYTLGEDVKMVKDTGLTMIMVLAILMSVWTASVSVAEEIEGRTALTLLSKPVGRVQFIFGKFLGVIAPALVLFIVLGSIFLASISYKVKHEARETASAEPTAAECQREFVQIVPGLVLAFLETVVLASIAVALSTRLTMLPNLLICATIYVMGHLAPLLAGAAHESQLVSFFGQFIATVLPNLDDFNVQAAVSTGDRIALVYVAWAAVYALLYSTVAMFLALLLFEDRDLA